MGIVYAYSEVTKPDRDARFRAWVRHEMQLRGWNQKELGIQTRMGESGVTRLFKGGGQRPTADVIVGLARAFNLTPTEVLQQIGYWPEDEPTPIRRIAEPTDIWENAIELDESVPEPKAAHTGETVEPTWTDEEGR